MGQTDENKKEIGVSSIDKYKKEVNGVGQADENKNKTGGGIESKREKGERKCGLVRLTITRKRYC